MIDIAADEGAAYAVLVLVELMQCVVQVSVGMLCDI